MPSLQQLQYLVALSETGHYRLAAKSVGVSQPTLSAQLLALERSLGVQLAERNRTSVILTAAGEQVLAVTKRIVFAAQEIECQFALNSNPQSAAAIRSSDGTIPTSIFSCRIGRSISTAMSSSCA